MSLPIEVAAKWMSTCLGRNSAIIKSLRSSYEILLDISTFGLGLPYDINGQVFRISPYHRSLLSHDYDKEIASFLKERVKPGSKCMIVGANVGVYVLQFAHWSGTEGRVVAFEPNPVARGVLTKHVKWNNFTSRVKIEAMAIGSEVAEISFYAESADGKSRAGGANPELHNVKSIRVPMTTISQYCEANEFQPDWFIFDIEGFEINALEGMEKFLETKQKPVFMVMEMHPGLWSLGANTSREKAVSVCSKLALSPIALSSQKDVFGEHGAVFIQC